MIVIINDLFCNRNEFNKDSFLSWLSKPLLRYSFDSTYHLLKLVETFFTWKKCDSAMKKSFRDIFFTHAICILNCLNQPFIYYDRILYEFEKLLSFSDTISTSTLVPKVILWARFDVRCMTQREGEKRFQLFHRVPCME